MYEATNPFSSLTWANLLIFKFSPIIAIWLASSSATVLEESLTHFSAKNASMSVADVLRACATTSSTYALKSAFFATKSVSELTSTIAAFLPSTSVLTIPSAAILPAFLAALAIPFSLKNSTALSISPSVAARAFLQSIIPAPVISLNSFTIPAVTAAII